MQHCAPINQIVNTGLRLSDNELYHLIIQCFGYRHNFHCFAEKITIVWRQYPTVCLFKFSPDYQSSPAIACSLNLRVRLPKNEHRAIGKHLPRSVHLLRFLQIFLLLTDLEVLTVNVVH